MSCSHGMIWHTCRPFGMLGWKAPHMSRDRPAYSAQQTPMVVAVDGVCSNKESRKTPTFVVESPCECLLSKLVFSITWTHSFDTSFLDACAFLELDV
eukprot:4581296-Amphidinium_carterae.1